MSRQNRLPAILTLFLKLWRVPQKNSLSYKFGSVSTGLQLFSILKLAMSEEKTADSKKFPANATKLSRWNTEKESGEKSSNEKQGRERERIEWKRKKDERNTKREKEMKRRKVFLAAPLKAAWPLAVSQKLLALSLAFFTQAKDLQSLHHCQQVN